MTEPKRTYESKAGTVALRRLAPVTPPAKPEDGTAQAHQVNLSQVEVQANLKIDLLTRLIKHLENL